MALAEACAMRQLFSVERIKLRTKAPRFVGSTLQPFGQPTMRKKND
jgi:hypothetical protein